MWSHTEVPFDVMDDVWEAELLDASRNGNAEVSGGEAIRAV
jgi:hypothetical protein